MHQECPKGPPTEQTDLVLPPEEHKITYIRLADGRVLANDSAGGFVIMDKDSR